LLLAESHLTRRPFASPATEDGGAAVASGILIWHASYYWLLLAESHLTRRLFGSMLERIAALPSPAG